MCVCVCVCVCVCDYPTPLQEQDATQGQLLNRILQIWIQSLRLQG